MKGEGRNKSRFVNTPYPNNSVNLKYHDQDLRLLRDKEATIITTTELTEAIGIMSDKEGTMWHNVLERTNNIWSTNYRRRSTNSGIFCKKQMI